MSINVDQLVKDAERRQQAAAQQAQAERARASREKAERTVLAESKSRLDYANTLKPRLKTIEQRLRFYANKIARGDKLDSLEQGEFDRLVEEYNSLDDAINTAIKDSYDIVVEARREKAARARSTENIEKPGGSTVMDRVTLQADKSAAEQERAEAAADRKPAGVVTGQMPDRRKNQGPSGKGISKEFSPARVRIGEEASMGAGTVSQADLKRADLQSLLSQTEFWFDLPDYVFNLDPKLGELLVKAVEKGYTDAQFLSEAKLTPWWQKNAAPIRQRIVARAKYDELRAAGQDVNSTEYALDTGTIRRNVQARARQMGAALDPTALEQVVDKIYKGFLENDELAIDSFIAPYIGRTSSIVGTGIGGTTRGFTGQALQNYQTLQGVAKANGLSLRDLLPGISTATTGGDLESAVLQKLATGELDINRIAQDARMIAGVGQPEFVRNLLNQGYDLDQIYAPYKNVMASVLELNPEEVDLKELSGYGLFSDKGETNIFDFKRALRKDSRWQYTEQARTEVADSVLGVLRDFGFQG